MREITGFVVAVALLSAVAPRAQTPSTHQAGIYAGAPGKAGDAGLTRLTGTMLREFKQTGMLKVMLSQGHAHGGVLAMLPGSAATTRLADGAVTFFIYLDAPHGAATPDMSNINDLMRFATGDRMPPDATNGREFALVRLAPTKDNKRSVEMTTGREHPMVKDPLDVSVEDLGDRSFKLNPTQPLAAGEYAFCFTGRGGGGQVWDFGVDAGDRR